MACKPIDLMETFSSVSSSPEPSPEETAIHSGKLGDVIYALPACQKQHIRHLILNCFEPENDPLRKFPRHLAEQLVPLLLHQRYLDKVSLSDHQVAFEDKSKLPKNIGHSFDCYRTVPRHLVPPFKETIDPLVWKLSHENRPVHLAQMMGHAIDSPHSINDAWLKAPESLKTKNKVLISVTHRWRTYPHWYWHALLDGLEEAYFIGLDSERIEAGLDRFPLLVAHDHLELASWIQSAHCFLGTVSFPYSLAEGLKVKRFMELCHFNLNVFPMGENGYVLEPLVLLARKRLCPFLPEPYQRVYQKRTHELWKSTSLRTKSFALASKLNWTTLLNQKKIQTRRILSQFKPGFLKK